MSINGFNFENTYSKLPKEFYQKNLPTRVSSPKLLKWNNELADSLGLKVDLNDQEALKEITGVLSGNKILKSSEPISAAYSGHQFGYFSPLLGDGRAHLLGELRGEDKKLYDLQLKGSGRSAFSRSGDGRSPLGPVIREYIVSEAMFHLGVPTTRSLAAVATGESVFREAELSGGILTRVSESLIRVGTFEYFASRRNEKGLRTLLDYVIKRSFPDLLDKEGDQCLLFFKEVMNRQIKLVAKWMSFGFIHGVMNTDNTSITGITIDYGPCAFLDEYDSNKVFSFIDKNGRYSYSNQPLVLNWNLVRLAETLITLYPEEEAKRVVKEYESELETFTQVYESEWLELMLKKIGLTKTSAQTKENKAVLNLFLNYLEKHKIDFTLGFRELSKILETGEINQDVYKIAEELDYFLKQWRAKIEDQSSSISLNQIIENMNQVNPVIIPRNHLIEDVISSAYRGDFSKFDEMSYIIRSPFTEIKDDNIKNYYKSLATDENRIKKTYCGT